MPNLIQWLTRGGLLLLLGCTGLMNRAIAAPITVTEPHSGSFIERLAAREVQRYLYLRTGSVPVLAAEIPRRGAGVTLLRKDDPRVSGLLDAASLAEVQTLGAEQYLLRTRGTAAERRICIIGGDETGLLHGAYRFCELIGVRFYLHGDVVPDERMSGELPVANETGRPLFALRGLLPFHDFPEGPDWWGRDDYRVHIAQLAKLRMNLFALHCYPEDEPRPNPNPHAEPLVWIGSPKELEEDGRVKASYPAFWAATAREGFWGYAAMGTDEFSGGASQLFPATDYAHEIFAGLPAMPRTPEQTNAVFNRAGAFFGEAFTFARALGVKTCIGTETPLTIPQAVRERLQADGRNPADPSVVQELYTGMFSRIQKQYPVDYYWLWTPEGWTWSGNNQEQYAATVTDIKAALAALRSLGQPFTLATCGWVLGPKFDRAALDHVLPPDMPMSCINREVGHDLIESGFRNVTGRPKWAVPWLENDPNMVSPQLWAGRMRYDAVDARALGCTGLLGIHWRTKILAPNVAALAAAAWDQSFASPDWDLRPALAAGKLHAGNAVVAEQPVQGGTGPEAEVCATILEDCHDSYILGVPGGRYTVTLLFNETLQQNAGARVFDVSLQDETLVRDLDIFARAGRNHVLKLEFQDIQVGDAPLHLHFTPRAGQPSIAGFGIEGTTRDQQAFSLWINLGGGAVGKFTGDYTRDNPSAAVRGRAMPVQDFYEDFARANFGEPVAVAAGGLFARIDGLNLPQSSHWETGPGGINPLRAKPGAFGFVDELAQLRPAVKGAGNLARYDYWLGTFRFQQALAEVGGLRADLDVAVQAMMAQTGGKARAALAESALNIRLQLTRTWEQMMSRLVACADTPGELGTIANLEQHNRKRLRFLSLHDQAIAQSLGRPLPAGIEPGTHYAGPARLVVPTVRSEAQPGEILKLTVLAIGDAPAREVTLHWRTWGRASFQSVPARHVGRAVHEAELPAASEGIEYYFSARAADGSELRWPASAPDLCQTVITLPSS